MLALRVLLSFLIIVSTHVSAHAAAPKQLYSKTVTISWGESGTYSRVSDGKSASPTGQFQAIVYISSAGRAFVRSSYKAGTFGGTRERGPEQMSNNVQFEGNKLVLTGVSLGVARRILTSFDASFASCTASVTIGKIGPNATTVGFDGAVYKVISMQAGASGCSIRDGNALTN
jgi:hypothetical protein